MSLEGSAELSLDDAAIFDFGSTEASRGINLFLSERYSFSKACVHSSFSVVSYRYIFASS